MITSPENFHDCQYGRESARDAEIKDAIAERIRDLEKSSGHSEDAQEFMGDVLSAINDSGILSETFHCYLFKLWQTRNAQDEEDKKKMMRAAQVLANTIAPIMRDIVSSDVHKEFDA